MIGTAGLLDGADIAALAAALTDRLRAAGVGADLTGAERLATALALNRPSGRDDLYWTARICLVRHATDLAAFDLVFGAAFDDAVLATDPNTRRGGTPSTGSADGADRRGRPGPGEDLPWATRPGSATPMAAGSSSASPTPGRPLSERLPSELLGVADIPFPELDPAVLDALVQYFSTAFRSWPTRRSRRTAVGLGGGAVDLRATLAAVRHNGFEVLEVLRARPVRRPRPVVMLCDVSRSMQPYSAAYLHLMRAARTVTGAEVFAFSTSLTRLTAVLAHRSPQAAMAAASAAVTDRFGGTRIAANLNALHRSRHGNRLRGAVVVIASDGWDSGPAVELAAAMARLRRRAHRIVWINPRSAAADFAPATAGMTAALPFCDALLPGHTIRAVMAIADELAAGGR